MPKLSIITINLNNDNGLRKTIESVINQTSDNFEYIVIDGGSSDGSLDVIKQHEKSITYWISEPDQGIYHAMNKGIKQAKGEYCQFLNSGDYLISDDVTDRMLADMPQCSFLYGNKIREAKGNLRVERSYAGRQITLLDMYRGTFFHATAYIRKSMFDTYGLFDQSLKIVSDWKFFLIAIGLNNESVVYKDVDMVWFDPTGISNTNPALDQQERRAVLEQILPGSILPDYQEFARDGFILRRLKRNKFVWFIIFNLYRILFQIDKCLIRK